MKSYPTGQLLSKHAVLGAAIGASIALQNGGAFIGYSLGLCLRYKYPGYSVGGAHNVSPTHGIVWTWLGWPALLGASLGSILASMHDRSHEVPSELLPILGYMGGVMYRWLTPPIRYSKSPISSCSPRHLNPRKRVAAVLHGGDLYTVSNRTLYAKASGYQGPLGYTLFGAPPVRVQIVEKGEHLWENKFSSWNGGRWFRSIGGSYTLQHQVWTFACALSGAAVGVAAAGSHLDSLPLHARRQWDARRINDFFELFWGCGFLVGGMIPNLTEDLT